MSEVILPNIPFGAMGWSSLPYAIPGFVNSDNTYITPSSYGRVQSHAALIAQNNAVGAANLGMETLCQLTDTAIYKTPLSNYGVRYLGYPLVADTNIFYPVNYQNKGVPWVNYHLFFNYGGVPYPSLPNGICYDIHRINGALSTVCFPEGSLSCSTTDGNAFIGMQGTNIRQKTVLDSSAGCPGINNYGASLVNTYSDGSVFPNLSTYQGSSLAVSPIKSKQPDLVPAFNWNNKNYPVACDLGFNMIAVLTGPPSYSGNPTLLRVYRYRFNPVYPFGGFCNGSLEVNLDLVYEKNLMDLMSKPTKTYYSAGGLISPAPGMLSVSVQQGPSGVTERKLFFFKFPGPIIQSLDITLTGAPSSGYLGLLTISNRVIYAAPSSTTASDINFIALSTASLNLNYSLTLPVRQIINKVNRTNTLDIININRKF